MSKTCSLTFALAVLAGTMFAVGCGQSSVPSQPASPWSLTEPSGFGTATRASASAATTVVTIPVEFSIQPLGQAVIQVCVGEAIDFAGRARLVAHQTITFDGLIRLDTLH